LKTNIAAFFPGQGSQYVGMGKSLFDNFTVAKETYEEASDAIKLDLKKLCFDSAESELRLTMNTQPALLVTSVASFRVAKEETGFSPDAVLGHSLGEYSALVAAGSIELSTAAKWVRARGIAMQEAVPFGQGTMAAIMGLDDQQLEILCADASETAKLRRTKGENTDIHVEAIVEPANYNSPGQTVISGSTDAVTEAIALIKSDDKFKGAKAILLDVSAPFHSRLMKNAKEKMKELFASASQADLPKTLDFPYLPNRTARPTREAGIVIEMLTDQIDKAVLWRQSISRLLLTDFIAGIEFGPGKVLQGISKRIAQNEKKDFFLYGCTDMDSMKGFNGFLSKGFIGT